METEAATIDTKSFVLQLKSSAEPRRWRGFFLTQLVLRSMATALTLVSVCVTVTNTQSVVIFGFNFRARYDYTSSNRFFMGANVVVCAFSAISLIFVYFLGRGEFQGRKNNFYLFLHDLVMTAVIVSACAASSAVGYVGQYGEEKVGWQPVCNHVPKFCNKSLVALVLSYLASVVYLGLTAVSAHRQMLSRPSQ